MPFTTLILRLNGGKTFYYSGVHNVTIVNNKLIFYTRGAELFPKEFPLDSVEYLSVYSD